MATVQDILQAKPTGVSRPKPLPAGTYMWITKGIPERGKSAKKGTDFVQFMLSPNAHGDDVDPEALKEALTKASGEITPLVDKTQRHTFYITENSIWRLEQFLQHLGFELDGKMSMDQMIAESGNRQVLGRIKHTTSDDGESVYAEIASTARPQ